MPLILSRVITNPIRSVSSTLLLVNVYKSLDVISALVTHTGRAYEVAG
jgi:hypothetical protein